jgi:surface antigen
MLRYATILLTALALVGCHTVRSGPPGPVVYQPPAPVYEPAPPPGHGGVPPGHGGVPPGLAKKGGVPPGLAKKGYRPVDWRRGAPPWYYGSTAGYRAPYGVYRDTCFREELGRALGAVAGGVAGYQLGSGHGKAAAVVGGTIIGALIGGEIGRSMDAVDQNCVGQILEHAPPNEPITWRDEQGERYRVTPSPAYRDGEGQYCREYQATATVDGRPQQTYGIACRQPDGSWKIVN